MWRPARIRTISGEGLGRSLIRARLRGRLMVVMMLIVQVFSVSYRGHC